MCKNDRIDPEKLERIKSIQPEMHALLGEEVDPDILYLQCRDCEHVLPIERFHRSQVTYLGVRYQCGRCAYLSLKVREPVMGVHIKCKDCDEDKHCTEFYVDRRRPTGRKSICKLCHKLRYALRN